jgi:hypothetical protein
MTMFFNLPDGTRFQAKTTKRGQHIFGVAYYAEFLATAGESAGEMVGHFGLASQHLTLTAASKEADKFAADASPMIQQVSVIEAI